MTRITLPGLIDIHVHLRDPGQTYKEDFYTGTSAALSGGVTTVFDMPNNIKPIFTYKKLLKKIKIANEKILCNLGLYFGTDGKNLDEFNKVKNLVIGLKIYLNLTTGRFLVDDEMLVDKIFATWSKNKVIIIHAEGNKVDLAVRLSKKYGNKIHITHVAYKDDLKKIISAKKEGLPITCDTTPHYLFLTDKEVKKIGNFALIKPYIGNKIDQDFLWQNIQYIDCIATDHSPHTIKEKNSKEPPTGFPGIETMLPLLLTAVKDGRLSIEEIIKLCYANPKKIFNIPTDKNTKVEIDLNEKYTIKSKDLKTKCGWSPFDGWQVQGNVKKVTLRGKTVFEKGTIKVKPGFGKVITPKT